MGFDIQIIHQGLNNMLARITLSLLLLLYNVDFVLFHDVTCCILDYQASMLTLQTSLIFVHFAC